MTTLLIARHGNTFETGETPRRVGLHTDLPLTEKGREQAHALGCWLRDQRMIPDVVYCSMLRRTMETAKLAIKATGVAQPVFPLEIFNEINYGPDENRPEPEVLARLGEAAMRDWELHGSMPDEWSPRPEKIIENWRSFADHIRAHDDNETVLVVTSNGVARFAPHIGDFNDFTAAHTIKLATGAVGALRYDGNGWIVESWNITPSLSS